MKFFNFLTKILNYNKNETKGIKMTTPKIALGKLKTYTIYKQDNTTLNGMIVSDKIVQDVIQSIEVAGRFAVMKWDGDTDRFYLMCELNQDATLAAREFYGFAKGYILAKDLTVDWDGNSYTIKLPSEVRNGIIERNQQALCFAFLLNDNV